ncbi:hypothetical protein BMF90_07100 [Serratia sp. OLHL2]|nr:hypothetical protein BMF92_17265 [Serratia sp. OLBL1]PII65507.1 hypothetical protein BMF90_07100 [Serratia sp. OLHL2]PII70989.1 hypothetical protein BMF88_19770 [Serratia sp. OLDL1]PII79212.1 hypothetical protein BMH23_01905 [Serratia sp. OLIL2]PII85407.1 hypothetical protein BMH24_00010 [Serratia sp. OLJL1]PII88420.1 hypothetical protein BMF91_19900 [Serratia sp. OLFL2]
MPLHPHFDLTAIAGKFPGVQPAEGWQTHVNAAMVLQRLWRSGAAVTGEIGRGGGGHHAHVGPDAHRGHILRHLFPQPDADVDVGQTIVDGDFYVDVRVIYEESAQSQALDGSPLTWLKPVSEAEYLGVSSI